MTREELNKACDWLEMQVEYYVFDDGEMEVKHMLEDFRKAMEAKESLTPEYDAEYLQSKIDAFTEARRKDGKTADEMLDDCRGGALELTWRDVQKIVQIEESMVAEDIAGELEHLAEPEAYYSEILKRFKEQ